MSAIRSQSLPVADDSREPIAPLENGDRLTRAEFERRYLAMPGVKAELIEGVVYMASPVRFKRHSQPHLLLATWLGHFLAKTPGLELFGHNGTVRLDEDNEPQPDLFLALPKSAGGAAVVSEDDYIEGTPDLVCEVASSSVSIDMHAKLNVYRRNSVREYLVWRVNDKAVDWFVLRDGQYQPLGPVDGVLQSALFPGLWLDIAALSHGDLPALFSTIDRGTQSPEHAAFVKKLAG